MFFALQLLKDKQQFATSFLARKSLKRTVPLGFYPLKRLAKLTFMVFNLFHFFVVFIYKQIISSWFITFKESLKGKQVSASSLIFPPISDVT